MEGLSFSCYAYIMYIMLPLYMNTTCTYPNVQSVPSHDRLFDTYTNVGVMYNGCVFLFL